MARAHEPKRQVRLLAAEKAAILIQHAAGRTQRELATEFRVSTKTIARVLAEPIAKRIDSGGSSNEIAEWQAKAQAAGDALDFGRVPPPLPVRPDHAMIVHGAPVKALAVHASVVTLHAAVIAEIQRLTPLLAEDPSGTLTDAYRALTEAAKVTIAVRLAMVTWGVNVDVQPGADSQQLGASTETIEAQGETLD